MKVSLFVDINLNGISPKLWGYSLDGFRYWGTIGSSSLQKKLFPVGENYKTESKKQADGYEYVGEFELDAIKYGIQNCMGQGVIPGNFDAEVYAAIRAVGIKLKQMLAKKNANIAMNSAVRRAITVADGTNRRYPSAQLNTPAAPVAQAAKGEEPKPSAPSLWTVLAPTASTAVEENADAWIW